MQIADFLARVVPPGNFLAVANTFTRRDGNGVGWANRFFKRSDLADAASYLTWQAGHLHNNCYFALASYKTALASGNDKLGRPKFIGERKQANTQQLRALWIDLDCARPGDGKDPASVFSDRLAALAWLKGFRKAVSLVSPNMMVDSGYGFHAYWILEDPISTAVWQPYADALRAAMVQHGFTGDAGITTDAARVLRPPETYNMKSGQSVPVSVLEKIKIADYPNELIFDALQPFVGLSATVAVASQPSLQATATANALAGGNVQPIFAGRAQPAMSAAMQAGVSTARPRFLARIATECEQVKLSLANRGKGEDRPLWYLGNLSLAVHCADGADFIHQLSDGDPRYNAQNVDDHFQRAIKEHAAKHQGPPTCAHYDKARPGICQTCPHHTKIPGPWHTGLAQQDDTDLPANYRRENGELQRGVRVKEGIDWHTILIGDVGEPTLDFLPLGGFALGFNYYREGRTFPVRVTTEQLIPDGNAIFKFFQRMHVVLTPKIELEWRAFLLAWIDKLRSARAERAVDIKPFGWAVHDGVFSGIAVGGTLYRTDGFEEQIPGGDPVLIHDYAPSGKLSEWRKAADLVMHDRVDLQMMVALSFGAPLMTFTGHPGVVFSCWSQQSAVGKTSAMKVARSVWSRESTNNALSDTSNAVLKRMGDTRAMPSFWDEMRTAGGRSGNNEMVDLVLAITQGRGKARMNADTSLREVGEWETILLCCSNYPLMEHVIKAYSGTDAGAVRLFETNINRDSLQDSSEAGRIIQLTKYHYGHAGRLFAKFVAANLNKVDRAVCMQKDILTKELEALMNERFLIAGMACLLVGAKIANKLGLCKFDYDGLYNYLRIEFYRMRGERQMNAPVGASLDLEQIMSTFIADNGQHKLITASFAPRNAGRGFKMKPDEIKWQPTDRGRVDIHISQQDRMIRISRSVFNEWCHSKGYPATAVTDELCKQWHAVVVRRRLASGTGYAPGQLWCLDIPAHLPNLSDQLLLDQAPNATVATPNPGNRPTV